MECICIEVNGEAVELSVGSRVADLAAARGFEGVGGVAVAVNGVVVKQSEWGAHELAAGDKVLFLTAAQGG